MSGLAGTYDLKDEDQAKEYLDKLGIEYRFQCYHEKDPEGCQRLADYLEAFKRDTEKARKVFETNCNDMKYGHSCFKHGLYNMTGRGGAKQDMHEALDYFRKGCDYGYVASCHNVALMHDSGKLGVKDFRKAEAVLQKSCDLNHVPSCQLLSTYYIQGKDGVSKDMSKAFQLAKKACDQGHMYACANTSIMYKRGEGVARDLDLSRTCEKRAKKLYDDVTNVEQTIKFGE